MNKIIFMGSPEFSVPALEKLNQAEDIDVALVITQKDKKRSRNRLVPTKVKKKALELGIESYEPDDVNSRQSLEKIDQVNPDFIVVIAYGQIIGDQLLESYKDRIINIHSSLLPKYRGAAPMQYALLNNDKKSGITAMLIEKTMDTGDILDKIEVDIQGMDIEDLHDCLAELAGDLVLRTIRNYDDLYKNRSKQDESKATYTKKIKKEMGHLDFDQDAMTILGKIRAFASWPSSYAYYKGQNVKIHNIDIIDKYNDVENGKIFKVDDQGVFVNCKDKCIVIKELQFPNKRPMTVAQYIRGNEIEVGEKLE